MAIKWHDKVISEYPQSKASLMAYQNKLQTLLLVRDDVKLLETFASFEKDHPKASTLQAFRYQIAQLYLKERDTMAKGMEWLKMIIEKAKGDSFYKDLAEQRLNMLVGTDAIKFVQKRLKSRGHYKGEIDGIVDEETRKAISDYQRTNGSPVTGEVLDVVDSLH